MAAEELMTKQQAAALFRCDVEREGGISAWARKHGAALGYVSDAYNGKVDPGKALLGRIGVMRVERYLLVRSAKQREVANAD